jgi:DNA-binding transcriptional ArsR family regulator
VIGRPAAEPSDRANGRRTFGGGGTDGRFGDDHCLLLLRGLADLSWTYYSTTKLFASVPEEIMPLPHPLPEDLAELIARRFRAIGEPLRVRMLDLLRDGELSVSELAEQVGAGQQNVSKHLAVLADAGMLARRKQGNHVYYRIADEGVFALCEQVCGSLQSQLSTLAGLVGGASA